MNPLLNELRDSVAGVVTDADVLNAYRHEWARDPHAGTPLAVVRATSTKDVQSTVRWASRHRIPIVPRGAGTGLSGGASAVDGGIVLSTEKMRDIRIDPRTRTAAVGAGAINAEVKQVAAEYGLWYPPDPSSYDMCTIGGNVATNAGGLCCVKYGVTADYVRAIEVVFADGTCLSLGRPLGKDVAGLPLKQLFIGSGGVLGIITEVTLRLIPKTTATATLVAMFDSIEAAGAAVTESMARVTPAVMEFMDRQSINAVEDFLKMGLDRTAEAMLLVRSDLPPDSAALEISHVDQVCTGAGAAEVFVTDDPHEGESFAIARRAIGNALVAKQRDLLVEDVTVPLHHLSSMLRGIGDIARRHSTEIAVNAHAGDGNLHR